MFIGKHSDGRVYLLVDDCTMPPVVRSAGGEWDAAVVPEGELADFAAVEDEAERLEVVRSAQGARVKWIGYCPICGAEKVFLNFQTTSLCPKCAYTVRA